TYCVGIRLDEGLVFASDSRTNAGVDNISTFRKMHVFEVPGERVIVLLTAGNLATTQAVISLLEERLKDPEERLLTAPSMFEAARLVGEALREVQARDAPALEADGVDFNASFILGGQIAGEPPRLFLIYPAGNFIEATPDTPFFQIGETKYGKPILDRVITPDTSLEDAAKCALVSFDSTMRSNLSVGLPLDLLVYERDSLRVGHRRRIDEDDPYFRMLRKQWSEGLRQAFDSLPDPPWE
uniref:Designed Anbu Protein n=1 Tax=synthetic construct TaxID=32630 RepID=UPI000B3D7BAA|nr:Chain A, Designed Anbu Protein [synthetic construct]5LOY_B Chain B, Designed Anbu Protein [synthetic construct]5LOY_C Chain C, Designed Anbu Protein [synthetic construct]5LOY_D Chain D, Designed Anbu Protein [synthetic construct]